MVGGSGRKLARSPGSFIPHDHRGRRRRMSVTPSRVAAYDPTRHVAAHVKPLSKRHGSHAESAHRDPRWQAVFEQKVAKGAKLEGPFP